MQLPARLAIGDRGGLSSRIVEQANNPVARRPCGDWSVESEKLSARVNGGVILRLLGQGYKLDLPLNIGMTAKKPGFYEKSLALQLNLYEETGFLAARA
jgi:hypothetical protein